MLTTFCLTMLIVSSSLLAADSETVPTPTSTKTATSSAAAVSLSVTPETPPAETPSVVPSPAAPEVNVPPAAAANTQMWQLRYVFQEGQKLRYQTAQKMTLMGMLREKKQVDTSELKQRRVFTVLAVEPDGSARIAMQFENVWMRKQADDQPAVTFDSDMKPSEVPEAFRQVARELKGVAPKYWLSSTGLSMHPSSQTAAVEKATAKATSPEVKSTSLVEGDSNSKAIQLTAASEPQTTPQEERSQVDPGSFLMTLPDKEMAIGQTWKETIIVPARMQNGITVQVSILRTFRLESVEAGIAKISFRCSIESAIRKDITVAVQLIQATPRGTITFDIARGLMIRREMQYDETVFNALGAESLLTSTGTNTEILLETDAPAGTTNK